MTGRSFGHLRFRSVLHGVLKHTANRSDGNSFVHAHRPMHICV